MSTRLVIAAMYNIFSERCQVEQRVLNVLVTLIS